MVELLSAMYTGRLLLVISSLTLFHGKYAAHSDTTALTARQLPFPRTSVSMLVGQLSNIDYRTDFSHLKALGSSEGQVPGDVSMFITFQTRAQHASLSDRFGGFS